jgi:peptidoglycan/xylan/chitin deacetylase (PgdA/CDA1 family)
VSTLGRWAKTAIATAAQLGGPTSWPAAGAGGRRMPLVIAYHRVVEDFAAAAQHSIPAMLISGEMLERHLDWLGRRFRFISLDELGSHLERGDRLDRPAVAITFDDGYRDLYEHAFPLLKRKGIPAAAFMVTDLIGTSDVQTHDKLYLLLARAFAAWPSAPRELARVLARLDIRVPELERRRLGAADVARVLLDRLPQAAIGRLTDVLGGDVEIDEPTLSELSPVTWDMLTEMQSAGMTIGSHSKTHAMLTNEGHQTLLEETAGSRRALESKLGIVADHFAYPAGRFDPRVISAVAAAGYRFGYTVCAHQDSQAALLTLPRKVLWQETCLDAFGRFSGAMMSCEARDIFPLRARCRQNHGGPVASPRGDGHATERAPGEASISRPRPPGELTS